MMVKTQELSRRSGKSFAPLLLSGLLLSGCMGAPTYGTGTRADMQLMEDVTGILSLAPKKETPIEYKPRPALVTPASKDALPPPQENVASGSNPSWPESPEQKRARLRADATARRDEPNFEPLIEDDMVAAASASSTAQDVSTMNPRAQRAEFKRRLALSKQGSATTRRYLSEPPLEYRQAAATAPTDDLGEDERKKEKRLKAEARRNGGQRSWADILPW